VNRKWRETTLGEVADFFSGGTPSKNNAKYWNGTIPWISAKDMKRFVIEDTEDHLTEDGVRNGTKLVPEQTVFLLTRGMTLLNDVPISIARRPMTFNQDVKALRPKEGMKAEFLPYLLLGHKNRLLNLVDLAGHGTGRLNTSELKSLDILVPPEPEQLAITNILGALDDKIELNRRMNGTLEATARTVFKSWFVDFDPVRAKAEGRQPFGMDAATAALFPDSFDDSPLGKVPKGWRVGRVSEFTELSRDTLNPLEFPREAFDHYSIPAFDDGRWPKEETGAEIRSNKYLVPKNAVLLSKLNPRIRRVWLPTVHDDRRSIASTEFLVALPKKDTSREYMYALFTSQLFLEVFTTLVTGTSGSHQRVRPQFLLAMEVVIPPGACRARFARIATPLFDSVSRNLAEARTLAAIRDALLPKLISGEIRVKNTTDVVETM